MNRAPTRSRWGGVVLAIVGILRGRKERRARRAVPLRDGAAELGLGALEEAGNLQEEMFVGDGADELEADGEACGSETTGYGNGGNAGEIGGAIGAEEQGAHGMIFVAETDGFLTDERRGDGCSWD
jgi:hypothetical protein